MTSLQTAAHPFELPFSDSAQDFLDQNVPLRRLELRLLAIPQIEPFRSAIGVRNERRALYVRWVGPDGAWGLGECSCRPDPFFSGEFVDGAWRVIEDFIAPSLNRRGRLQERADALGKLRGWPFTVAAVLDAAVDMLRRQGVPDLLDRLPGKPLRRVPVGISLGLFNDTEAAVERVRRAVNDGYHRIKLKVAPHMDVGTVEAIRHAFPDLLMGFDANGSCSWGDLPVLERLAALEPHVFEQPFAPDRLDLCRRLKEHLPSLRLCLDESITGLGSLLTAHQLGSLDEVNIKPGRIGGPLVTARMLQACSQLGLPAWVGGMFESGVGRHANLRVAARLHDALGHDLSPSSRYFRRDVLSTNITMDEAGYVDLGDGSPPVLDENAFDDLTQRRQDLDIL